MAISTQLSLLVPLVFKAFLLFLLLSMVKSKKPSELTSTDSVHFNYLNFLSLNVSQTITFQGDARVSVGSLQLTKIDSSSGKVSPSRGLATYSSPVRIYDNNGNFATWYTSFNFLIKTDSKNPADGLTFFLAPTNFKVRDDGGGLGIFYQQSATDTSKNQIIAVEFDTWSNTEYNEPAYRHIGIDINSAEPVAWRKWEESDALSNSVGTAHISYDGTTKYLNVIVTYPNGGDYVVSRYVNLANILPDRVIIGFSAATGHNEKHFIQSWRFTSTL